jgi:hypothetical protein
MTAMHEVVLAPGPVAPLPYVVRRRSFTRLAALGLAVTTACSHQDGSLDPGDVAPSRAFGIWRPGSHDTCSREQHDAYAVLGPDGKAYPTWHPPTGPGGCSFGHEHGRDPRDSDLHDAVGELPFGYASEMLALADPAHPRDEDHVGHKVEWENDLQLSLSGDGVASPMTLCDVLIKLHQGTHSDDAFSNNLHELIYHLRCEDGTEMHVTLLVVIGRPGQFARSCSPTELVGAGPPAPANSPAGFGVRLIPDRTCIERHMLVAPGELPDYAAALHESWHVYNSVERADGHALAFFNPYFQVRLPSRFHDPALASDLGRPIEVCYEVTPSGERAGGGPCEASTGSGTVPAVEFDDPRSRFNGTGRFVDINAVRIANAGGPQVWYTDALGHQARTTAFPGAIRQVIAPVDRYIGVDIGGPSIGGDRRYDGPGVRSPN